MTASTAQTPETPVQTAPGLLPTGHAPAAALRAAVAQLGRVIPARSSNPLLTMLLLRSQDGHLSLSGTDLYMDWRETIEVPDLPPFEAAVSARRLAQFMTILGKQQKVPLGLRDNGYGEMRLDIYAEEAGTLMHLPLGDYGGHPLAGLDTTLDGPMTAPDAVMPAGELVSAIRCVRYASSNEAFQAVFRGLCFTVRHGVPELAASDGYRVALYRLSTELPYMIVPRTTADLLLARLATVPAETEVRVQALSYYAPPAGEPDAKMPAERVRVQFGGTDVVFKGMQGQYPDYDRIMPTGAQASGEWTRAPLLTRLRALGIMADNNANNPVGLTMTGTLLTLKAESDHGETTSILDLSAPIGGAPSVTARYNLRHMREAAQNAPEEALRVGIKYHDPKNPADRLLEMQSGNYRAVMVCLRV